MKTDYEWAPIPGASPEAEAILDALKDRKASDNPDHAIKTMVLGDAATGRVVELVKALRKHTGVSIHTRHGKTYAEWAPERVRKSPPAGTRRSRKLEAVK